MLSIRYKSILGVALPLMVSTFIQSVVLLTDAAFLSRYSTLAFDASGNAGLIFITLYMTMLGLSDGSQILIARRIGQKKPELIGRIFGTSILSQAVLGLSLFFIIQLFFEAFVLSYSKFPDIAEAQNQYISIRSYSLTFAMISLPIQAFFFAQGKTWVVLVSAVVTASSNIVLDYLFIFGFGDFQAMGLEGAALASVIGDALGAIILTIFLIVSKERKELGLLRHMSYNFKSFLELIKIGYPLMLQGFFALATWSVFFSWIEQIGKFELTVSQNIRAIYFLAFVPIFGFAATTKTYISQYLGAEKYGTVKIIQKRIQLLTFAFLLLFFHGALLYPEKLIALINPNELYIEKSAAILRFIFLSFLIFGYTSVYFQTINASGHTNVSMIIEIMTTAMYLFSSYLLIKVFQVDIYYVWGVEYVYFGLLAVFSLLYLRFFEWKKKLI